MESNPQSAQKNRTVHFSVRSVPILLALVTLAAYSIQIRRQGFYWDDWAFAFLAHTYGPAELVSAFSGYRPFLGPLFFATTSLLGTSPLAWQIFGLLVRFLLGYACWWMLTQIWPRHPQQNLTVTLFFLVFPGYSQQWVALTHTNQELFSLLAYLFSIGLTASAVRTPERGKKKTAASMLLGAFGLFTTEYFIGYEFIRLIVLYLLTERGRFGDRLKNSLRGWLPYGILWFFNLGWLLLYYRSGSYHSYSIQAFDGLSAGFQPWLASLMRDAFHTLATAGFLSWFEAPNVFSLTSLDGIYLPALALFLFALVGISLYRTHLEPIQSSFEDSDHWGTQAVLLGLAAILLGRVPSWAAGLPIMVKFDYDRFFLSMMLGASLLLAGLMEWILKPGQRRIWLAGFLTAFAICAQYQYAIAYQRDWQNQEAFYSQLAWRAPGIQPNTLLLTDVHPSTPYVSDMGLSAGVNWMYQPDLKSHQLPYLILYTDIRLGNTVLPSLSADTPVHLNYRTAVFEGNTSQSILFYQPEVGCLRVVDPNDPVDVLLPDFPSELLEAVSLANLNLIDREAISPALPEGVFFQPAEKGWCYYYEKAELARQSSDWREISQLGYEAARSGYGPDDPNELMPFIEAYLHQGDLEKAGSLMAVVSPKQSKSTRAVCTFLNELQRDITAPAGVNFIQKNRQSRNCPK